MHTFALNASNVPDREKEDITEALFREPGFISEQLRAILPYVQIERDV
tara:strand:+ start:34955 stop:35098 length:144 start_codon:yes stop_codon:yes gene_type:complete